LAYIINTVQYRNLTSPLTLNFSLLQKT